ncbi:MAG: tRNA (adenosine(37)-N6)-threonylcarbamoyltransferase complex dimerization subunit type 1 TsaB [Chloroflexota bacterium]
MILLLDTATRNGAAGLWDEGLVRSEAWHSPGSHTAELLPAVQRLLEVEGLAPRMLDGIAVVAGPGGFSALRAGLGVAKGLALGLGCPLVGVSSLEATAQPLGVRGVTVCAVLEAGRGTVAWARYRGGRAYRERVGPVAELLTLEDERLLFCGEGADTHRGAIEAAYGARAEVAPYEPGARLVGVGALGAARLSAGEADDAASLEPRYLRAPSITPPKRAERIRRGGHPA